MSLAARIAAVVCFILALFGVPWPTPIMVAAGLALWCGSTLLPPNLA